MSWISETALPFSPTAPIYFSPIIGREVYVIDRLTNFWKYNLGTKQWTELASPNYIGLRAYRTLVPDDITNPTKLYCPSEHSDTGDNRGDAIRLSIYNIAGNSWTDSTPIPPYFLQLNVADKTGFQVGEIVQGNSSGATAFIASIGVDNLNVVPQTDTRFTQAEEVEGQTSGATTTLWLLGHSFGTSPNWVYGGGQNIKSIVYKDATHIYCWQAETSWHATGQYYYSNARCVCYNPTADTWEAFSSNDYLNTTYSTYVQHHRCAAINASGTIIYSGEIYGYKYCKYTLAADTYVATAITSVITFSFAHIENKLPYTTPSTMRQGYLDTADDSENDGIFTENTERDSGYGNYFGVADDLTVIIAHAKSTAPELMSEGIVAPTVTTDPASSIEQTTGTPNGTLDDYGGQACDCGFEYGETTDYGTETPTESKTSGQTFSQEVRGLKSGIVYHFRAIATNAAGTSYGADRSFHTEALSAEAHQALGKGHALGRAGL